MSNQGNFDKFTERSRRVLSFAQEEAQRFQHGSIGTEHLLIALRREDEGLAGRTLAALGLTVEQLRRTTGMLFRHGDRIVLGEIALTADAKKAIEGAVAEAQRLNHSYIGTEHLLLGLTLVKVDNRAQKILQHLGLSLQEVHDATMHSISSTLAPPSSSVDQPGTTHERLRARLRRSTTMPQLQASPNPLKIGGTPESLAQNASFSPELLRILGFAQEEAKRFQHNYIGTEHLLLGLLRDPDSNAAKVLNNLGVQLEQVREAVEFIIGRGDRIVLSEIGFTPRSKKVLLLAADAAYTLKSDVMKPEHLLIGLVYEGEGIAAGVLESLGVTPPQVLEETTRVLANQNELPPPEQHGK